MDFTELGLAERTSATDKESPAPLLSSPARALPSLPPEEDELIQPAISPVEPPAPDHQRQPPPGEKKTKHKEKRRKQKEESEEIDHAQDIAAGSAYQR